MKRRTQRLHTFALVLSMMLVCSLVGAHGQIPTAQRISGLDLVKEASLAGTYQGRVLLPEWKPATLILSEGLQPDGTNFVLLINGEKPIRGRIAGGSYIGGGSYVNPKAVFASLKVVEDKGDVFDAGSSSLSLRLTKGEYGVTLKRGRQLLFDPCLPSPGCKSQPGCEPC